MEKWRKQVVDLCFSNDVDGLQDLVGPDDSLNFVYGLDISDAPSSVQPVLQEWRCRNHPIQNRRRIMEETLMAWSDVFPPEIAALCGEFLHLTPNVRR